MQFKTASKWCKMSIIKAKCTYDNNIANCFITNNNPNKFWSYLRNHTKSKTCDVNNLSIIDNKGAVIEKSKASNIINQHFYSFFTKQNVDKLNSINFSQSVNKDVKVSCPAEEITDHEIFKAVKKMKKSTSAGTDSIIDIFYWECLDIIMIYLRIMFNLILWHGCYPESWKTAIIIPIPKKGKFSNLDNLRPISLLNVVSKIFEYIINNHLSMFIDNNNLLCKYQFGFHKYMSTTDNLLYFTKEVNEGLANKNVVHAAYIDFKHAFDCVSHKILIKKLINMNFHPSYVDIISNYLTNRTQICYFNGIYSNSININSGIPQGGLLAPLLFNIFINDLASIIDCKYTLYADDIKIFKVIDLGNYAHDVEAFQACLNSIWHWSTINQLPINTTKTFIMVFASIGNNKLLRFKSPKPNDVLPNYNMGNQTIKLANSITDLGIQYNNSLSYAEHMNNIRSKATHAIFSLSKNFRFTTIDIKLML